MSHWTPTPRDAQERIDEADEKLTRSMKSGMFVSAWDLAQFAAFILTLGAASWFAIWIIFRTFSR